MKKLNGLSGKFAVIASLAAVTMFGTGYAAWQFSDTASMSQESNTSITTQSPSGKLTVEPSTFYLVIDQAKVYFSSTGEDDTSKEITSLTLNYVGSGVITSEKLKLTAAYDSSAFSSYLTFTNTYTTEQTLDYTGEGATLAFTYTLPTVTFTSGKKPLSSKSYQTMKTALASAKVSFTFTTEIVED
jgi:hypothetical protein